MTLNGAVANNLQVKVEMGERNRDRNVKLEMGDKLIKFGAFEHVPDLDPSLKDNAKSVNVKIEARKAQPVSKGAQAARDRKAASHSREYVFK